MLGEAVIIGLFQLLLAAPAASAVDGAEPAGAWNSRDDDERRAARLLDEFLAPLANRKPDAALESELRRLVARMGDEDWAIREAASTALIRHGVAAAPILREARTHRDPEVAFRAREALEDVPADALRRILRGFEVGESGSAQGRRRRIVAELAAIQEAATAALSRFLGRERGVAEGAGRYAREAEEAKDNSGAEVYRYSGRVAEARVCALTALSAELEREIAELRERREEYRNQPSEPAGDAEVALAADRPRR